MKFSKKHFQKIIPSYVSSAKKPGAAPGTLVYVGKEPQAPVYLTVIDYDDKHFEERRKIGVEELAFYKEKRSVSWIDMSGVYDIAMVEKVGQVFGIHGLVLEDILHTNQRPKLEEHEGYLYFVMRVLKWDDETNEIAQEQMSFVLGDQYLLSFQEVPGDIFEPFRERMKNPKWRSKKRGSDYLLYALMDAVVDHYFLVLEKLSACIESLEGEVSSKSDSATLEKIYRMKREILFLRKSIWPLREVLNQFLHLDSDLVQEDVKPYVRDVYDHSIQVVEIVESLRDMLSGLQDLYLSMVSNRMNDVMKVLTIIATIFIPPTFIAGLYGMNFDNIPELHFQYGYFYVLGVMTVMIIGLLVFFKNKKWI